MELRQLRTSSRRGGVLLSQFEAAALAVAIAVSGYLSSWAMADVAASKLMKRFERSRRNSKIAFARRA